MVFLNGPSSLSLWKLFGVLIISNAKFSLAVGMVRISRGFQILGSLWGVYYFYTRVCLQMTFGMDLCHIGTSKLICVANRWTGSCAMMFLTEGHSKQTMTLNLWGRVKYITVLCFSIRGSDARVPAPSHTSVMEGFLEGSLLCWVITGWECVFTMVQMS